MTDAAFPLLAAGSVGLIAFQASLPGSTFLAGAALVSAIFLLGIGVEVAKELPAILWNLVFGKK